MIQLILDFLGISEVTFVVEVTACVLLVVFVCLVFNCFFAIINNIFSGGGRL